MFEGQSSRTAERVAIQRAAHQVLDSPIVLEDPLALSVIAPEDARLLQEHPERHDASPISRLTRAIVVVRSRIAEEELAANVARGVRQYLLLGAGFDTFAYRNPFTDVRVFEVDHPWTQRVKRERLAAAGVAIPANVIYAPCDFSEQSLATALAQAGFERTGAAVIAWLGVVMYLDADAVRRTLEYLVSLPSPTSLVFDYALPPSALPLGTRMFYQQELKRVEAAGEPWKSFHQPEPLRRELMEIGFTTVEDLGADEINQRYLVARADGLTSGSVGRIAIARR